MRFLISILTIVFILSTHKAFSQGLNTYQGSNHIVLLKDNRVDSDWLQGQLKRLKFDHYAHQ